MKDFSRIVEEWAMKYKPMQHEPGETSRNQRFFLIADIMQAPEFMSKISKTKSPCVLYEYMWEGEIKGGKITPDYTIYFPVCTGTSKQNPRLEHKAIMESAAHAFEFLTWIRGEQDKGRPELEQLDTDHAYIRPFGPLYDGWYTMYLSLSDVDTFSTCVNPDNYVEINTKEGYE